MLNKPNTETEKEKKKKIVQCEGYEQKKPIEVI